MAPSAPSPLQLTAPLSSCTCISLPTSSRVRKTLNSELWHACTGPFVSLPQVKILIYYLSQGHSEELLQNKRDAQLKQLLPNSCRLAKRQLLEFGC
ncbi:auxin response factor 5 isoform X1 [Arachis hypogaea]|uniref:auxin response factor 5 isoform X1 n=1 Tax=Arachis hypogaea TaxID=3818 RepID=UPI003B22855C